MLSASSQCGGRSPLSPLTQTTLEKHLPGLPTKRFLQQNKVLKVDVGCITGTNSVHDSRRLYFHFQLLSVRFVAHSTESRAFGELAQTHASPPMFVSLARIRVRFFFFFGAFSCDRTQSILIFLMRIQTKRHLTVKHIWHTEFAEYSRICLGLPKGEKLKKSCPF